ncbi:MAG: hypothetical protein HY258_10125 [Chloroflexi bacterium]|nr:hypothetical protein [Chloroflexota bacterium]
MKKNSLPSRFAFIILLLLTACASAIPPSTASIPPSITPSPRPTLTPSITPSATITPTPLPPTPNGAQGFDYQRQLSTKTENGTIYYYIPEIDEWAIPLNQKPIWLVNSKNYPNDVKNSLPAGYKSMSINYYRTPDAQQVFYSVEEPDEYESGWFGDKFSLAPHMWHSPQELVAMLLAERLNKVEEKTLTAQMLRDVLRQIGYRHLILALDVPVVAKDNSQVTTKYWDPNKNIDFIQVPWESTQNDPSFFGRLSYSYHWKLDVRGGKDRDHPGNLVVIYATSYTYRLHDWEEADVFLLGPIFVALISQQEPLLDYVSSRADDMNNFTGERTLIHQTKGISYQELDASWHLFEMTDFAYSASISAYFSAPFLEYRCIHFEKDGTQTIIYCYAPSEYLIKKSNQ